MATAVNSIVGLNLNSKGTPSNSPLVDGGSNEANVKFTFDDADLQAIKNAATYDGTTGTFTLLLTNKTSDMTSEKSGDRTFHGSNHVIGTYRPYIDVDYNPVVLETNSTITSHATLNSAFDGIAAAGTGAITLYDDATITSRCETGTKTITVESLKDVTISSTLNNSIWILNNQGSGNLTIGSDDHQITVDGGSISNSKNHLAAEKGTTTIKNITFKDCNNTGSIVYVKSGDNATLNMNNITFDGCTTAEGSGIVGVATNNVYLINNITFNNCSAGSYNFYLDDTFLRVNSLSETQAAPITLYRKTAPTLATDATGAGATVILSQCNQAKIRWFQLQNEGFGIARKANNDGIVTEAYTLAMNAYGASTLILPYQALVPANTTAYTLNYTSGKGYVKATEVTDNKIPANTPVLVNGTASTNIRFYNTAIVTETTGNDGNTHKVGALTGVYADNTSVPADSYILWADATHDIGFYLSNSSTVDAYHAYLTADGAGARSLTIVYGDDDTQGISAIDNSQSAIGKYYDLQGRRVSQPTKGLYIVNGKKVAIK